MPSEVERARTHMFNCQARLATARRSSVRFSENEVDRMLLRLTLQDAERDLLAALSWLWDAQQREIIREGEQALRAVLDHHIRGPVHVLMSRAAAFEFFRGAQ